MNTPPYGVPPLETPVMQARDRIYEALLLVVGATMTEAIARERANNAATALLDLLMPRSTVVKGEIDFHEDRIISGPVYNEPPRRKK